MCDATPAAAKQASDATPTAGATGASTVSDRGPVESLQLPEGWEKARAEKGGIGQRLLEEYKSPAVPDVSIALYQEGLPLSEKASRALKTVMDKGNHQLMPSEIVSVRDSIGYSNAGHNQYTDKVMRPAFHLSAAGVQTVNDQSVLVVEGKYNNGGKMFKGIFAPYIDESGKTRVQQVYMEGSAEQFPRQLNTFNAVTSSIKWKANAGVEAQPEGSSEPPPRKNGMIP
jgi:hypothetical protein